MLQNNIMAKPVTLNDNEVMKTWTYRASESTKKKWNEAAKKKHGRVFTGEMLRKIVNQYFNLPNDL